LSSITFSHTVALLFLANKHKFFRVIFWSFWCNIHSFRGNCKLNNKTFDTPLKSSIPFKNIYTITKYCKIKIQFLDWLGAYTSQRFQNSVEYIFHNFQNQHTPPYRHVLNKSQHLELHWHWCHQWSHHCTDTFIGPIFGQNIQNCHWLCSKYFEKSQFMWEW
jgi:hypothetical protein